MLIGVEAYGYVRSSSTLLLLKLFFYLSSRSFCVSFVFKHLMASSADAYWIKSLWVCEELLSSALVEIVFYLRVRSFFFFRVEASQGFICRCLLDRKLLDRRVKGGDGVRFRLAIRRSA